MGEKALDLNGEGGNIRTARPRANARAAAIEKLLPTREGADVMRKGSISASNGIDNFINEIRRRIRQAEIESKMQQLLDLEDDEDEEEEDDEEILLKEKTTEIVAEKTGDDQEIQDNMDVDMDDDVNEAERYEAWKAREIARIKKDKEDAEALVEIVSWWTCNDPLWAKYKRKNGWNRCFYSKTQRKQ